MPVSVTYRPGSWPDVGVLPDGRPVLTYLRGTTLCCEVAGVVTWSVLLSENGLYQRMAVSPLGKIVCAWQGGQSGLLTVVLDGWPPITLGPTRGQNVCGCYWVGERAAVVVQRSATRFERVSIPDGTVLEVMFVAETSQGVRDVRPDGSYVLGDAARSTSVNGWTLSQPMTRAIWTVGQADPKAIKLARTDQEYVTTALTGDAYEPHVAVSGDTVYACARTPKGAALAVLTPPYPARETPVVTVTAIGRPMWLGWFTFSRGASLPANCDLPVDGDWMFVTAGGKQIAVYVAGMPDGDVASLERNALAAKSFGLPVIGYWTRKAQEGRVPRNVDWVGVEAYRSKDDSLSTWEAKVRAAVAKCPQAVLIAQCYTSNATLTADLASLVPVYAEIAKECGNVVGILAFSGSGRPTGLQDNPSVRPLWESLAAGIPGPPEVEDDMNKPVVKVTRFDGLIQRDGWRMELEDSGNPGVKVQLFTEDGGLRVKLINPAGSNTTGAQRKVLA